MKDYTLVEDENKKDYNEKSEVQANGEKAGQKGTKYSIGERSNLDNVRGRRRASEISTLRDFSRNSEKAGLETKEARQEYLDILRKNALTKISIDNIGKDNFISYSEINELLSRFLTS